ncbi:MAG: DUF2087 domain-containing protein [Clostridia bacterium]|nr:DUF2087 domain-containing protein [Clostridia bacterium]
MYTFDQEEYDKVAGSIIKEGKLTVFPSKEKRKFLILHYFIPLFEKGTEYSEKQVNEIIMTVYPDFATIRRALVDYGMLRRTRDCKQYWIEKE